MSDQNSTEALAASLSEWDLEFPISLKDSRKIVEGDLETISEHVAQLRDVVFTVIAIAESDFKAVTRSQLEMAMLAHKQLVRQSRANGSTDFFSADVRKSIGRLKRHLI